MLKPIKQLMFKLPFPIGCKVALEMRGFAMGGVLRLDIVFSKPCIKT